MLVEEFSRLRLDRFSDGFYESIPTICEDCGYPLEISETLTQLHCSNPRCISKVTQRLDAMTKQLGVKNFGEARIRAMLDENYDIGFRSPLCIFMWDAEEDGAFCESISLDMTRKIMAEFNKKRSFTLAEYVRIANIPNVQTSASAIFGDYDDLYEAYKDIEANGLDFIQDKLSIGKEDISIRAVNVYDSLMTYKQDLFDAIDYVDIIKTHEAESINIRAVVSDEVGSGFKTKAEFYAYCNSLSPNLHVEFLSAVNKSIHYLIWAGADGTEARYTNKVQKVEKYNTQYAQHVTARNLKEGEHFIHIMTAKDFVEELKRKLNGDE